MASKKVAKKTAIKTAASKSTVKKVAAKKTAAKKTVAKKTPAAKKTAVKKAAPRKVAKAKKAPAAPKSKLQALLDAETEAKAKRAKKTPKNRIDTPEIQEKVRELIKLAKEQEYLTYDDINEILPNDLVEQADVEAILERLRSMEFDIIDASEVDRYRDKKREGASESEPKSEQKLDILDDPVRMYLKQMGQVPLLTREQEVEISKRIEDAELTVQKFLHRFGFVPDSYLQLADKLIKGKERFDRVILDKKIESRERYMKTLPKLCDQLRQCHEETDNIFRKLNAKNPRGVAKLEAELEKQLGVIAKIYQRFYYKQKVVEDFCEVVE
ncbi:MAG: RNA polymerase primary sigma factor, partial [Crocinitomicaceae bacterium]